MGTEKAAASELLETVARERGLHVQRLDHELVLCHDDRRRVLFVGLVGSLCSRLAAVLCANDAWVRDLLARRGLPVVATRLAGADDAEHARRLAEQLGYPVRLRIAGSGDGSDAVGRTAQDAAAFHRAWRELVGPDADRRTQVVIDAVPDGPAVEVAVVGGAVVDGAVVDGAATGDAAGGSDAAAGPDPAVVDLAVQAVAAVPTLPYGVVRIVATDAGPVVDRITPAPSADAPTARAYAGAVLDVEFGVRDADAA